MHPQEFPSSPVLALTRLDEPVRREDLDGDNWPITWADDDALYAAYGDGWGCRPLEPDTKRNTGLVRLHGGPAQRLGDEIPCPWFGGGAQDPNLKGCGLLCVDGILYHFLRHQVGRHGTRQQIASRLIWSRDHGGTWEGAADYGPDPEQMSWFFREPDHAFHSPTFLQAGRDYSDAPDAFVYVYSPHEDARLGNDRLVLARVPREQIVQRSAWRFFSGLGVDGRPTWAERLRDRQPVLECPGHVGCGDVVYLPALGRFVLASNGGDGTGQSSLLLLDAPAPWGPWSLVGYVPQWGSGTDGDSRYDPRLPVKWWAEDGSSATLVFSDRRPADKFNVQRLELEVRRPRPRRTAPREGTARRLHALADTLMQENTEALLVTESGHTRLERYAPDWGPTRPHYTASLAKTLVGAMCLVIAWGDNRLSPDDPAARHVREWAGDARRAEITVRQLAVHTSGLDDAEEGGLPHDQLPGWKGRFWQRGMDAFSIARDEAGLVGAPGTRFLYSNPGNAMLGYCVCAALQGAPDPDLHSLLRNRLLRRIGVNDAEWSIGGPTTVSGLRLHTTWGGAAFTAPATAAIGRLLAQRGRWERKAVLDEQCLRLLMTEAGTPRPRESGGPEPANGLCIWLNVARDWPELPADTVVGAGAGHQLLLVIPSLDLVVVRYGGRLAPGDFWGTLYRHVLAPLGEALG